MHLFVRARRISESSTGANAIVARRFGLPAPNNPRRTVISSVRGTQRSIAALEIVSISTSRVETPLRLCYLWELRQRLGEASSTNAIAFMIYPFYAQVLLYSSSSPAITTYREIIVIFSRAPSFTNLRLQIPLSLLVKKLFLSKDITDSNLHNQPFRSPTHDSRPHSPP